MTGERGGSNHLRLSVHNAKKSTNSIGDAMILTLNILLFWVGFGFFFFPHANVRLHTEKNLFQNCFPLIFFHFELFERGKRPDIAK